MRRRVERLARRQVNPRIACIVVVGSHANLQPARLAIERIGTELAVTVQLEGEEAVCDGHSAKDAERAKDVAVCRRVVEVEDHVIVSAGGSAAIVKPALIGESWTERLGRESIDSAERSHSGRACEGFDFHKFSFS